WRRLEAGMVGRMLARVAALAILGASALSTIRTAAAQAIGRGTIDTLSFWSQSLGTNKRALVWLPPSYGAAGARRFPSLYYLHGLWGSEIDWTTQGKLDITLDSMTKAGLPEMIVVMPDGDDGWYTTWNKLLDVSVCRSTFSPRPGDPAAASYCVPWPHYDDYIARDLVAAVDARYRTDASRAHRAIAGLSMGGYGAVTLALQYPDVFRAAASHSGVVSPAYVGTHPFDGTPRYAASDSALEASWGDRMWPLIAPAFGTDTAAWFARDPTRRLQRMVAAGATNIPAIFLDCGTEDGLVDQARVFRLELTRLGQAPAYAEWPGKHDWDYWRVHARESLVWLARQVSGTG
ncbi:MAG: alpha/beta hydrolase family protein, partial [Gemmatimonadota bacterium]